MFGHYKRQFSVHPGPVGSVTNRTYRPGHSVHNSFLKLTLMERYVWTPMQIYVKTNKINC